MSVTSLPKEKQTLLRLARYAFPYRSRLILAIATSFIVAILSIILVSMIKPVVDVVFTEKPVYSGYKGDIQLLKYINDAVIQPLYEMLITYTQQAPLQTLACLCAICVAIAILNGIFRFINYYMVNWLGNRVILDIQTELFDTLTGFKTAYYAKNKVGALTSYFIADSRVLGITVSNVFGRLLLDPIQVIFTVIYVLYLQWKLTLIYALIAPFIVKAIQFFAKKNRRAGHEAQYLISSLSGVLQEHFSYIRLVQCYNMYTHQKKKFWKEARGVFSASMSMAKATAASSPINELIGLMGFCLVLLAGGYFVFIEQSLNRSDFVLFIALLWTLYQPIKRIDNSIQQVQLGLASTERIFEALDTKANLPRHLNETEITTLEKEIFFDHVSFQYMDDKDVLKNICFTAKKGEQIAFVGPSGAGKTTLANLIPRFFDPTNGKILIDGQEISTLSLESLRNLISLVPQEVMIFNDSVYWNITCGNDTYSMEQAIAAAKAANAHEFIENLPNGYHTVVGERGTSLSGGQCQRIAIARAFLRDTPILIFDEATSSLDSESEQRIKESMQRLVKGRTSFIIAHRLSTILQADKIVVLDNGVLDAIGHHQELLQTCKLYQKLYNIQFNTHHESPDE